LESEGKTRHDLRREKFIERAGSGSSNPADHHPPDAPARRLRELGLRRQRRPARGLLHDGHEDVARGDRGICAPARTGPDLSGKTAGQLGSGTRDRGLRPGGGQRGGRRSHLGNPLSVTEGSGPGGAPPLRRCSATPPWRA
jgi:hypothetical protein